MDSSESSNSPVDAPKRTSGVADTSSNPLANAVSKLLSKANLSHWRPLLKAIQTDLPEWGTLLKGAQLSVQRICKSSLSDTEKTNSVVNFLKAVIRVLDKPILKCLKKLRKQTSENAEDYDEPSILEFGKRLKTLLASGSRPQSLDDRITLLDTISTVRSAVMSTDGVTVESTAYQTKAINGVVRNMGSALLDKSRKAKARLKDFARFNDMFTGNLELLNSPFLLDYISKGIFVFLWAQKLKPLPVDLVINRESAFNGMVAALHNHRPPLLGGKDKAKGAKGKGEPTVLTFRAYFRSEFGAKEVNP